MIKLTQTQAKAVAAKIRERLYEHDAQVREELREQFINSDEYKNKLREAHEAAVTMYQAGLKLGITIGVGVSGRYCTHYLYKEEDIAEVEQNLMNPLIDNYVDEHRNYKGIPGEDKLVTDLIFESLTSEGIEDLMNKFIEPYL
jgi:hypothetical protein